MACTNVGNLLTAQASARASGDASTHLDWRGKGEDGATDADGECAAGHCRFAPLGGRRHDFPFRTGARASRFRCESGEPVERRPFGIFYFRHFSHIAGSVSILMNTPPTTLRA